MSTPRQPLGPRQQALVDALKSGKFEQINYRLHDSEGYCCLGVACEISGLGEFGPQPGTSALAYFGEDRVLPNSVMDFYGFKSKNGGGDAYGSPTALNDAGRTFIEIAEEFERNPWRYFEGEL